MNVFNKIIDEHIQSDKGQHNKVNDFVDVMLGFVGSKEYEYRIWQGSIRLNQKKWNECDLRWKFWLK